MKVVLRIHEAQTDKIHLGQRAIVTAEGISGKHYTGEITKIAVLADSQNRWLNPNLKEYDTEITLDENSYELKPGVTARAEILVRQVENVIAVPVQAIYSRSGHTYVFVGKNEKVAKPVEIEAGHSNDQFVEIRSGLKEGDRVLLAHDSALLAKLPDEVDRGPGAAPKKRPPASRKRSGRNRLEGVISVRPVSILKSTRSLSRE